MAIIELTGTTDGAGDLTVTADKAVTGFVEKIVWDNSSAAATADITFSAVGQITENLLVITDQAQADAPYYPRAIPNKVADASAFTDAAVPIFVEGATMKMVVAQGGATKVCRALVHVREV